MAEQFTLYDNFVKRLFQGVYDLSTHSLKAILCNSGYTPVKASHYRFTDITNQLTTGNGYTQNAKVLTGALLTVTAGVVTFDCDDIEWTAAGGSIGPARYLVLYDDTSAEDNLIGYVDFLTNRTAGDGSLFRIRIATTGLITSQQV